MDGYVQGKDNLEMGRNELEGIVWFISLLTRVDGLVVMDPRLRVRGFGALVTQKTRPTDVFSTNSPTANIKRLSRINYDYFGTRHQSMMRYCARHPESVGFVVSQDGDVRVMTSVNDRLVMWRNISLQNLRQVRLPGTSLVRTDA